VAVTDFYLRTLPTQPAPPPPSVLLDWFEGNHGSTVQAGWDPAPIPSSPRPALDLFRWSASVFCADRTTPRPGTWTRTIRLSVPVRDTPAWRQAIPDLQTTLNFLSGDRWHLEVTVAEDSGTEPAPPQARVDAVCLLSGGLDSLSGAVDLLADGNRVCLVGHYEVGKAPAVQSHLANELSRLYGPSRVVLRRLFLRPSPPSPTQARPLPTAREATMRARSLLFICAGLAVASSYGDQVPLYVPENGFIGLNVPLTLARTGSLSTRTTHPYFISSFGDCAARIGVANSIVNPFRVLTKGEALAGSHDLPAIRALAGQTLSCAHPEAARYAGRPQGNCGYCYPCLIRRASLHHIGLDDPAAYSFDVLHEDEEMVGDRGSDLRCLLRSLYSPVSPVDTLRNGPLPSEEVGLFFDMFERGRTEILDWILASQPGPSVRKQLPA
jgi:7-cyano-7-deazaguanine synthase in queuosine biosynthesis